MTSDHPVKRRKKLIEVAIPLEAINAESSRRKRKAPGGFPTSFHKWWAQRPSAAAAAVLAAQLIDDPGSVPEEFATEEEQQAERSRLTSLIKEACLWENCKNRTIQSRVWSEISKTWARHLKDNGLTDDTACSSAIGSMPPFLDPFAGGGIIPLEAQRLGLEANAWDLNPIPVLINKGLIELPGILDNSALAELCGKITGDLDTHTRSSILAKLVEHYGSLLIARLKESMSSAYPELKVTEEMASSQPELQGLAGGSFVPAAWIWTRTVPSPNPGFKDCRVPLMTSFVLSSKDGRKIWVDIQVKESTYNFVVRKENAPAKTTSGTKAARGANFKCILSGDLITPEYVKRCSQEGTLDYCLVSTVIDTPIGRVYMPPTKEQIAASRLHSVKIHISDLEISGTSQYMGVKVYGLDSFLQLFTERQAYSLKTMYSHVLEMEEKISEDLENARKSQTEYLRRGAVDEDETIQLAKSVTTYLAIAVNRVLHHNSTACTWLPKDSAIRQVFPKQAIQMSWDFTEGNIFGKSSAGISRCIKVVADAIRMLPDTGKGSAKQCDARGLAKLAAGRKFIISTDPPYYDNVPYSDLADYFYFWTRICLSRTFPDLFPTVACPKADELVAFAYRHGGSKSGASEFFLDGMSDALAEIKKVSHPGYPVTIYYAFRQKETGEEEGFSSTGWETFLSSVISAGLSITTTWPLRTEGDNRQRGVGSNALATSIVLVCYPKSPNSQTLTKNQFKRKLRELLPGELAKLEQLNIPPVDVAQAAIGPGMSIFSGAKAVLNPDDSPMSTRDALVEINLALDEHLSHGEASLDPESRFAITFFESYGYDERPYGDAEGLAVARNISVESVVRSGIMNAIAGKAQLLRRDQLLKDWDPALDSRLCVWEATQYLIKRLERGETLAGALLAQLKEITGHGDLASSCRALAYRLYNHCEKSKQAEEARAYNGLVIAWPELEKLAAVAASPVQPSLL
jgi:putative DNA methylase